MLPKERKRKNAWGSHNITPRMSTEQVRNTRDSQAKEMAPVSKSTCHDPMRIWVCILNIHENAECLAHVCDPRTPEMGVRERIPEVHGHRQQESTSNIQTYAVLSKVEGTLHYPVTSVHVPQPPLQEILSVKQLRPTSPFLNIKGHRSVFRTSKCTRPWVQTSEAHVLLWMENYEIKVLRMQNIFWEKKSQVIFCHPLNTQVSRVGEELLPRQFSLEEQICIVPYMTDVLHFFSYHN